MTSYHWARVKAITCRLRLKQGKHTHTHTHTHTYEHTKCGHHAHGNVSLNLKWGREESPRRSDMRQTNITKCKQNEVKIQSCAFIYENSFEVNLHIPVHTNKWLSEQNIFFMKKIKGIWRSYSLIP